ELVTVSKKQTQTPNVTNCGPRTSEKPSFNTFSNPVVWTLCWPCPVPTLVATKLLLMAAISSVNHFYPDPFLYFYSPPSWHRNCKAKLTLKNWCLVHTKK
ncbi:MAG: hypothetical protein ACK55Z_33805, partial [bacterium]